MTWYPVRLFPACGRMDDAEVLGSGNRPLSLFHHGDGRVRSAGRHGGNRRPFAIHGRFHRPGRRPCEDPVRGRLRTPSATERIRPVLDAGHRAPPHHSSHALADLPDLHRVEADDCIACGGDANGFREAARAIFPFFTPCKDKYLLLSVPWKESFPCKISKMNFLEIHADKSYRDCSS